MGFGQQIGKKETYRGYVIEIESTPPDMIAKVNDEEFTGAFFKSVRYARDAAKRHIDALLKEKQEGGQ